MTLGFLYRFAFLGTAIAFFGGTAAADLFHLKDGRTLEGRILSENEDSYLLEVLVARGIRDETTVDKKDVVRIEREEPDQREITELRTLLPIPDLLPPEEYGLRIETIRQFIETYPDSAFIEEAKQLLEEHLGEAQSIEAGGIKLDGKIIQPHERIADKYHIDSRIAEAEVRRLAQSSSRLIALRAFKTFESEFSGSEAWHSLLPFIRQLASAQRAHAQELLAGFDDRIARQESGLSRMSPEERQTSLRAIAERDTANRQRHEEERAMRDLWPSVSQDYKPSLEDTIRFADQEIRRLSAASSQPLRQPTPSQVWRNSVAEMGSGDVNRVRAAIQAARSARMPQRYLDELQSMADSAK
ncbi:MAG: PTPDL family protein [Luteolibacter sp.]|jgi:hypothetical protein